MTTPLDPRARVMITDADAPLARAIRAALLTRERTARVLGVLDRGGSAVPTDPREARETCDFSSERAVRSLLHGPVTRHAIDTVVHGCGAVTSRARASSGVESLRALLTLCREHPTIRRIVLLSSTWVYRRAARGPALLHEEHPIDLGPTRSPWRSVLIEADVTACARVDHAPLEVVVLRLAEVFAPGCDGPLSSLRGARMCATALGFDPIVELLSLDDAARAVTLACTVEGIRGVFNVPGRDLLPLSSLLSSLGARTLPLPLSWLPWFNARRVPMDPREARDDGTLALFRHGGVLDGGRAHRALGYTPTIPVPLGSRHGTGERTSAGAF
jgi:nucleoside-diphosphate-sugar epimerase